MGAGMAARLWLEGRPKFKRLIPPIVWLRAPTIAIWLLGVAPLKKVCDWINIVAEGWIGGTGMKLFCSINF
jgi:hypothetical protein